MCPMCTYRKTCAVVCNKQKFASHVPSQHQAAFGRTSATRFTINFIFMKAHGQCSTTAGRQHDGQ